jgi:cytochrome c oxidase assembly protein subunit 15
MPLGSAHQANALNLFTAVLLTLHCVRPAVPGPVSAALARFGAPVAAAAVAAVGLAVTRQH